LLERFKALTGHAVDVVGSAKLVYKGHVSLLKYFGNETAYSGAGMFTRTATWAESGARAREGNKNCTILAPRMLNRPTGIAALIKGKGYLFNVGSG